MSTKKGAGVYDLTPLKNEIHAIAPLFELEGEWTVKESRVDSGTLKLLHNNGAIKSCGSQQGHDGDEDNWNYVKRWTWREPHKTRLKEYWENLTQLPCGHRAHIHNAREVPDDKLSCRHCNEKGEYPEFEKDMVADLV